MRELFAEIGAALRLPEATVSSMVTDAEALVTSLPRTLAALHAGETAHAPSVTRWLTDPVTGQILTVGRQNYRIPNELRLALTLEDETCRFPGCRRRAQRCELDHVHAWADRGETSHANLASLCSKHHHLKHESEWAVEALPGRKLRWTSPIGRRHTTEPANPTHPPWRERSPSSPPASSSPPTSCSP